MVTVVDKNGKRRRPSRTCKTASEAHAAKRQLLSEYEGMTGSSVGSLTLSSYLLQWLAARIDGVKSKNTAESYRLAVERHINPRIGRIPLTKLQPRQVEKWLSDMRKEEVGARTIQNAFVVLKMAMKRVGKLNEIRENPCNFIERPKYDPPEVFPFEQQDVLAIIESCKGERLGPLVIFALATGARQGELFGLAWKNVDFAASSIAIKQQVIEGKGFHELTEKLKTKASRRSIEIPDRLLLILNEHRSALLKERNLGELVFVDNRGGC